MNTTSPTHATEAIALHSLLAEHASRASNAMLVLLVGEETHYVFWSSTDVGASVDEIMSLLHAGAIPLGVVCFERNSEYLHVVGAESISAPTRSELRKRLLDVIADINDHAPATAGGAE